MEDPILVFWHLDPSIKSAITPLSFDQIEKFLFLISFAAQGPSPQVLRIHMAHDMCPQTCLYVGELLKPTQICLTLFATHVAIICLFFLK